jgi:hypothetical protein
VNITTQNKVFNKGHIEVYRALVDELLQFHQLKRNSNHFDMFYLNAQKLPGFSMHEMQCTHLLPLFYNLKSWDITKGIKEKHSWEITHVFFQ